jgi:hypothetical protein
MLGSVDRGFANISAMELNAVIRGSIVADLEACASFDEGVVAGGDWCRRAMFAFRGKADAMLSGWYFGS